ncbi:arsenate reductase (glutaredoxin) [Marinimicrobium sp. ABcell2]|uniref:arsenate reductase (glutaredoxin) n=1 Tax=Marinimicrobium sp. ABcell2 TaxID=3069751 RepID=UPI0027AECE70|nr:arsenate reductase (glutaredoxin) [Marinimicrobium sp. ABcell2]MDQ2075268.1 arsenate reductase (glutaredoxin) [Marinimicrobium sp. ABcell2]
MTLYHNPRCSKSRQALALLQERGAEPTVVRYLETPMDAPSLQTLLQCLGIGARDLLRTGEPEYKDLNLADETSEQALINAMVDHPKLIERPILVSGKRAVIGRPPERVLELLESSASRG